MNAVYWPSKTVSRTTSFDRNRAGRRESLDRGVGHSGVPGVADVTQDHPQRLASLHRDRVARSVRSGTVSYSTRQPGWADPPSVKTTRS